MTNVYQEQAALAAFDALNSLDPRRHKSKEGEEHAYELLYGQRMSVRLQAYAPEASLALRLAARAQHLERWAIPRIDYPMDRTGYLRWRNDLKAYHADRATEVLKLLQFDAKTIERVRFLLQKKQLRKDVETQILEDVICQVFLEHYALKFAAGHAHEKVVSILRKTWVKMSVRGQAAALKLVLPPAVSQFLEQALAQ